MLAAQHPSQIKQTIKETAHTKRGCGHGLRGEGGAEIAVCGMVAMERTTGVLLFVPTGSDDGVNDGVAFAGSPDETENAAAPPNPLAFHGTTGSVKLADWPAVTLVDDGVGVLKVKSGTRIMSAEVVPPPVPPAVAGLFTLTFSVPLFLKQLAGSVAVSDVELTGGMTIAAQFACPFAAVT